MQRIPYPLLCEAVAGQIMVNEDTIRGLGYHGQIEVHSIAFAFGGDVFMAEQAAVSATARGTGDSLPGHADAWARAAPRSNPDG